MDARGLEREQAERLVEGMQSDADAEYVKVIEIDASGLRPMIAYAGSCTAGKKVAASSVAGYIPCWDPGVPIQRAPVREPAKF